MNPRLPTAEEYRAAWAVAEAADPDAAVICLRCGAEVLGWECPWCGADISDL